MEDTPELLQKMILPHIQLLLYGFDVSKAHSLGTVTFPVRMDPYNVVTDFCVLDIESSYNAILGRPLIYMMRDVPSTHHQLLKYLTPSGMVNIRGDQAMARTITAVTRKKSGWMTKTSRAVSDKSSPMNKKENRMLTNSNYRTAKAKTPTSLPSRRIQTPTHPSNRETQTARPRRNPSRFL